MTRIILILLVFCSMQAQANWSMNFGYNNPPGATVGLNLLNFWDHVALEFGVGYVSSTFIDGDINLKYLFMQQVFRPYIQGGFSTAITGTGVGLGFNSGYAGGGFFLKGNPIYFYASYNITGLQISFGQVGLGFEF